MRRGNIWRSNGWEFSRINKRHKSLDSLKTKAPNKLMIWKIILIFYSEESSSKM